MSIDTRTASMLSTIRHNIDAAIPAADELLKHTFITHRRDARRLALLIEDTGRLAAAITTNGSLDADLERIGGHVTAWLLAREQERAR